MVSVDLYFQSDAINKTTVINQVEANVGTFTKRNLNLDLFLLDPKVGVQVKSTLMQDYTSNLSNASSSDATELQNRVLDLLTPGLRTLYGNSLQDPPSVSFRNSDGLAAMDIDYNLNYTTNVAISSVLEYLVNNAGLINITRLSSMSVNDIKPVLDVFTLNPRFTNQDYGEDLKDRNSKRFIELKDNITQGLSGILKDFNVKQIFVQSFQQGSVISTVETTFPSEATSYSQVTQAIVNKKDNLAGLNLYLDPQSLYTSPVAPTNPPPASSVPGYGVAIIVMCILLILAIPLVIVLALKTDLCRKLSNACSLKPPYERYHGVSVPTALTNYRTHSYDFPH
ncbi:mucin-1-like [Dendrobates tinctorius]|uniref:mucin-1-like n=1 Tax=Dendrobates tinctorius TaxID=92724 RepID=UPI003CCA16B0